MSILTARAVLLEYYCPWLSIPNTQTKTENSNTFLSVGGRVRNMAVGISNAEMPILNSTSINAILKCFEMVRPFTLNTKLVLTCNTSEKTR